MKDEPKKSYTKRRETSGVKPPVRSALSASVNAACNAFFDSRGMARSQLGTRIELKPAGRK